MSVVVSPDCRDSNCSKCDEAAWDDDHDEPTTCGCGCHADARVETHLANLRKIIDDVLGLGRSYSLIPAPTPTDPRERALHLRKHRNTGPAKAVPGARQQYGGRR